MKIPFLGFAFFLVVYIILRAQNVFILDEDRFVYYADNLLQGFYAPHDTLFLWNGPGYPLLLIPFRLAHIPLIWAKLINVLFLEGGVLFLWINLRAYLPINSTSPSQKASNLCIFAIMLYAFLFGASWLHLLMTEMLAFFLIAGGLFFYCRLLRNESHGIAWIDFIATACFLGYLILTKFFFAYVVLFSIPCAALGFWSNSKKKNLQTMLVLITALFLCTPYLLYTYRLTGKFFYWGNTGGSQLYTLTVPEPKLLGDVIPMNVVSEHPEAFPSEAELMKKLASLNEVEKGEQFKKAAIANIKKYPKKFFLNWCANVNRLIMDYPFSHFPTSHSELKTGNLSFTYAPIFFLCLLCLWPTWKHRKKIPVEILYSLGFAILSLAGLSLLSAYSRFIFPLLPIFCLWISLIFSRFIEWKNPEGKKNILPTDKISRHA